MNILSPFVIAVAMTVLSVSSVLSQDFQKGLQAYDAGDYLTALKEFLPLADDGDAESQYLLGTIFQDGYGIPQDFTEAAKWYSFAADQNHASAQLNLAALYYLGNGVPQDYQAAYDWSRLSAIQSNESAQFTLGLLYQYGDAVEQNNTKSHMWYNIAYANGAKDAGEARDMVAGTMTPEAIAQAQGMARECVSSGYRTCGW
jgi:TPR repeat protein